MDSNPAVEIAHPDGRSYYVLTDAFRRLYEADGFAVVRTLEPEFKARMFPEAVEPEAAPEPAMPEPAPIPEPEPEPVAPAPLVAPAPEPVAEPEPATPAEGA